jgi:hypothetical protein
MRLRVRSSVVFPATATMFAITPSLSRHQNKNATFLRRLDIRMQVEAGPAHAGLSIHQRGPGRHRASVDGSQLGSMERFCIIFNSPDEWPVCKGLSPSFQHVLQSFKSARRYWQAFGRRNALIKFVIWFHPLPPKCSEVKHKSFRALCAVRHILPAPLLSLGFALLGTVLATSEVQHSLVS